MIGIGENYLNLIKSGNILFKNWTATVYCDGNSTNTIKINFGVTDENKNIFGNRDEEFSTLATINKVIKYLSDCYKEWLEHIDNKRQNFPLLNYFTLDQLVILREELTKINSQTKSKEVERARFRNLIDLLYNLNDSVDLDMMLSAHEFACSKMTGNKNQLENNLMEVDINDEDEITSISNKLIKEWGFSSTLIRQAMKIVGYQDENAVIEYCLNNEEVVVEDKRNSSISLKSQLNDNFNKFISETSSFEDKIRQLWIKFKELLDQNLTEILCLDHVGYFLRHLKEKSTKQINRQKPPYLEAGIPNLVVCDNWEIIPRVLNLYMFSPEQPLPNDDEIIFCTEATKASEVEIFLRRAISKSDDDSDNKNKIFCLANVQNLEYDQAVKVAISFENLNRRRDFILCIFCSQEKVDKSVLATSFYRYKKKLPDNINLKEIEIYLKHKFKSETQDFSTAVYKSERSGCGKSLKIKRLFEHVKKTIDKNTEYCCISIKKRDLSVEEIFSSLKEFDKMHHLMTRVWHFDIAYEVWNNVDSFLFQLICMSVIKNSKGEVWRRSSKDLYLVEIMPPMVKINAMKNGVAVERPLHSILNVLPAINCLTPFQGYNEYLEKKNIDGLFDTIILNSPQIQRPCQYLIAFGKTPNNMENVVYNQNLLCDSKTCLEILLSRSEIKNPSWSELIHFSSFLNTQLEDCERSIFCQTNLVGDLLPNFKTFVVKFMIQMSHDFALPSLEISDRSALHLDDKFLPIFQIDQVQLRRRWETNPHPMLFFNPDGQTFTFFGFYVDPATGTMINPETRQLVFENITISKELIQGIELQDRSLLKENISQVTKIQKISKILHVMGKTWASDGSTTLQDPDPSYELTMDNVLKMMGIYMRFRCNIPVIIMGETGCGKTRLIKYLCDLQKHPDQKHIENMYLVKVHGGVTSEDMKNHMRIVQRWAYKNYKSDPDMYTILFFDEANSTEAIGTIKEIMCDGRINGQQIDFSCNLKIIAACNPYKKHSMDMIKKFEQAGLGFYVDVNESQDKLGNLPMRQLVYRVQPLPASMLPMIWDFGQLNDAVEKLYIMQIVSKRCGFQNNIFNGLTPQQSNIIIEVLSYSQNFMRKQKNECSFVSLRDVQRGLSVIEWFLKEGDLIFQEIKTYQLNNDGDGDEEIDEEFENNEIDEENFNNFNLSVILAMNVCYHACLQNNEVRKDYRIGLANCFGKNNKLDEVFILNVIDSCYEVFLNEIKLPDAIARNQALKENLFMMILCIELKIPLFLVGKPGK